MRVSGSGERGTVVFAYGASASYETAPQLVHALTERLAGDRLLMHPRQANPGHYDASIGLCREHGFEPEVELRAMSFDLGHGPIQRHEAVAIVGESSRLGLPNELCCVPLLREVCLEVSLLVRSHNRSPVVDRTRDAVGTIAAELGWT